MKIAHFSPLPPDRTGVADYCWELLPELSRHAELDIWVERGLEAQPPRGCGIVELRTQPRLAEQLSVYDSIVYHFGNSKYHHYLYRAFLDHPGVVVMHDLGLHHFFAEYFLEIRKAPEQYVEEMEYNYGLQGRAMAQDVLVGRLSPPWETQPLRYPLNKRVLDLAEGVIVHSEFAKRLVQETHPHLPVRRINMPIWKTKNTESVDQLKMRYGIPLDRVIVASFGMVTPNKRIETVLRAIERLKNRKLIYLLVGEVASCLEGALRTSRLEGIVRPTGYVSGKAFEDYCAIADVCVNLRYPTSGETSASVCRLMAAAKACVVSDTGWFSELPDDCVAKVDVDEREEETLLACLESLIANERLRAKMGANAREYVWANHSISSAASHYVEFLREVNSHSQKRRFDCQVIDGISTHIAHLGVTDEDLHLLERPAEILARLLG